MSFGITFALWLVGGHALAVSWPGFRGPNSSGVAPEARPPVKIGPTNHVLWKIDVPFSPSSPCISEHAVFLTAYANHELETRCYSRMDGKLLWSRGLKPDKVETFHSTESSPAASTPAMDDKQVVSYFGSFGLVSYSLTGKEVWRYPLPVALSLGSYGTASSPLIAGNLVIVSHDRDEESVLIAVDLHSGRKVWETPRPDTHGGFGSPVLWKNAGVDEVVVPGCLKLKGYALGSGKEDWMVEGVTAYPCTTPVPAEGWVYFAAWTDGKADDPWPKWEDFLEKHDKNKDGVISLDEFEEKARDYYRGMDINRDGKIDKNDYAQILASLAKGENIMVAVKPGGRGNITKTHVAWQATRGLPYVASPLFYEGRIYCIKNGGMISSFDAKTGRPYYLQERLEADGNYYSSPVAADGRIYTVSSNGKMTVIKAGGDKPEILHQANFGEAVSASPAIAGNNFYLRTKGALYAFGEKE